MQSFAAHSKLPPLLRHATSILARGRLWAGLFLLSAPAHAIGQTPSSAPSLPPLPRDSVVAGALSRTFDYFIPPGANRESPLVFAFHGGSGGSGARLRGFTRGTLERLARRERFVVIYPDGIGGSWNDCREDAPYEAKRRNVDDVGFVRAIVAHFRKRLGMGARSVFAIGYSNGGHLAYRLALEAPDLVHGIAVFGANLPANDASDCRASGVPVPVMIVNGTADRINPYEGGLVVGPTGDTIGAVRSAPASAEFFAALDDSVRGSGPIRLLDAADGGLAVDRRRWAGARNAEVVLLTIHGGGHTIPGSSRAFPAFLGSTERRLEALEEAIGFFLSER